MQTLFIGKNLLFLSEVESTNTYAMNLLRNVNCTEGTVIHTDNQTHGKGQRGALWNSKSGLNTTASIILKPQFLALKNTFFLSKISALAVYDVLTEILANSQYDIKIKWPNDILVNQHKIAGILIENTFTTAAIQNSIIGIGINVNQVDFGDFLRKATSIKLLKGEPYNRNDLLELLCIKLEKWYLKLKTNQLNEIDELYLANLYGINKSLYFMDSNDVVFTGIISGVNNSGQLILKLSDSSIKQYDIKEIKFLD